MRFAGVLRAGGLSGTFVETGHAAGSFLLHRAPAARTQAFVAEDVNFRNGAVTLGGTILAPHGGAPHAAAVLTPGSGPEGRWAFRFVAEFLASHGVVALIYDKRGVGASTGNWQRATLEDLAGDARAAVDVLARRRDVDPHRIGFIGHSQGAFIAPYVARDRHVRWIVAEDGNVGPQYRQDLFRVRTSFEQRYHGRDLSNAMRLYSEFVDTARNGSSRTRLRADEARAAGAAWYHDLGIPDDRSWVWAWYRRVGNDDNRAAWRAVRVPVLLVYGADDRVVPVAESVATIRALLRANDEHPVVRVLPHADHTLHVPPRDADGWPRTPPDYPAVVLRWIAAR